jgi:hypothetical protein
VDGAFKRKSVMLPPLMPKPIKKCRPAAPVPARGNDDRARATVRVLGVSRTADAAGMTPAAPRATPTTSAD